MLFQPAPIPARERWLSLALKAILLALIAVYAYTYYKLDDPPEPENIRNELFREPVQTKISEDKFAILNI